ncbi:MAG: hypothetical protein ACI89L_001242 [Phycisphaerales bacterium]|jgi:hypothetical protein
MSSADKKSKPASKRSGKAGTTGSSSETVPKGADRRQSNGTPPAGLIVDRRLGIDRRDIDALSEKFAPGKAPNAGKFPKPTSGLERRRGPGRRLSEFAKSAEEGEMNKEQFLFLMAIDEFKKSNDKPFPTWTDVLEVFRLLGYRKTCASELNLTRAEDWHEKANAPSNVRPEDWSTRPVAPMGEKTRIRDGAAPGPFDADSFDEDSFEFDHEPTAAELAAEELELENLELDLKDLEDEFEGDGMEEAA